MKKGWLFTFLLLGTINFISAQNVLSDLLNTFDESLIILSAIFILSFTIIFFALNKSIFKENTPIAAMIAVVISFLIVYGANRTNFDFSNFFFEIGISESVLMTVIPLLILGGVIFTIIKLKGTSLFVFGGLLIVLSFFVYSKATLIFIAIVLFIIGFILMGKKKGKVVFVK